MGRWVGQIVELCMIVVEAIQRYVLSAGKLHGDDTTVPVLSPGNQKTTTGRFWVYVRDDRRSGSTEPAAGWFTYSSDRKGVHPRTHLANFKEILQADAYAGFDQLYAKHGNVSAKPGSYHAPDSTIRIVLIPREWMSNFSQTLRSAQNRHRNKSPRADVSDFI